MLGKIIGIVVLLVALLAGGITIFRACLDVTSFCTVSGTLLQRNTDISIVSATIKVIADNGYEVKTKTDQSGFYSIEYQCQSQNEYMVTFSHPDYLSATDYISSNNKDSTVDMELIAVIKEVTEQGITFSGFKEYSSNAAKSITEYIAKRSAKGTSDNVQCIFPAHNEGWKGFLEGRIAKNLSLYSNQFKYSNQCGNKGFEVEILNSIQDIVPYILVEVTDQGWSGKTKVHSARIENKHALVMVPSVQIGSTNIKSGILTVFRRGTSDVRLIPIGTWGLIPSGEYRLEWFDQKSNSYQSNIRFVAVHQRAVVFRERATSRKRSASISINLSLEKDFIHLGDNTWITDPGSQFYNYNQSLYALWGYRLPIELSEAPKLWAKFPVDLNQIRRDNNLDPDLPISNISLSLKLHLLKPRRSAPAIVMVGQEIVAFLNDYVVNEMEPSEADIKIPMDAIVAAEEGGRFDLVITVLDDVLESYDWDKREDFIIEGVSLNIHFARTI